MLPLANRPAAGAALIPRTAAASLPAQCVHVSIIAGPMALAAGTDVEFRRLHRASACEQDTKRDRCEAECRDRRPQHSGAERAAAARAPQGRRASPGRVLTLRSKRAVFLVPLTRYRAASGADKVRPAGCLAALSFKAGRLVCAFRAGCVIAWARDLLGHHPSTARRATQLPGSANGCRSSALTGARLCSSTPCSSPRCIAHTTSGCCSATSRNGHWRRRSR
jgi:hypothetical protein